MADWQRSTREASYASFSPAVHRAIADYAEKRDLGDLGSAAVFAAETTSTREKRKLFGKGSETQTTSILVTPELLVWVVENDDGAVPLAAKRSEIEVKEFHSDLVDDTGLEVFGFVLGAPERATAFIGLGPGAAADRLRARLAVPG